MLDLHIPASALSDCIAILGKRGSGKSGVARGLAEAELAAGHRLCVLDPKGDWWGLRLTAAGEPSPWPVAIFGGEKADVPIEDHMGPDIARLVAGNNLPCLIDLSGMSVAGQRRFATGFAETLYDLNRAPLTLIVDEADQLAPKAAGVERGSNLTMLVHRMARLVKMGRSRGIFMWMITQRPAVLHNDLLSQAETMVAMRLTLKADRDAAKGWFDTHSPDAVKAVMDSLPGLKVGEGWVCAGGEDMLERVQFPMFASFDSSRTPQHGEAPLAAVTLGTIDLSAIREALAVPIEAAPDAKKSAQNIPDGRDAELSDLRGQLAEAHEHIRIIMAQRNRAQVVIAGYQRAERAYAALVGDVLFPSVPRHDGSATTDPYVVPPLEHSPEMAGGVPGGDDGQKKEASEPAKGPTAAPASRKRQPDRHEPKVVTAAETATLTGPQRQLLGALAWWANAGHAAPTRPQVAGILGWKITSGHLKNVAGSLRSAGLIDYPTPGAFALTDAGAAAAPQSDTDLSLIDGIRGTLSGPQRLAFDRLLEVGSPMTRDRLAADMGWAPTSGHVKNVIGSMRALELLTYPAPGVVALQEWVRG